MPQPKVITALATYFDNYTAGDLGSSATAFYCAVCIEWDQLRCPPWVSWRLEVACAKSGLSRNTIQKARNRLEAAGWLEMEKGDQKRATKYRPKIPSSLCQKLTQNEVNSDSESDGIVTQSRHNRDENVVPYNPIPGPTPNPQSFMEDKDDVEVIDETLKKTTHHTFQDWRMNIGKRCFVRADNRQDWNDLWELSCKDTPDGSYDSKTTYELWTQVYGALTRNLEAGKSVFVNQFIDNIRLDHTNA